MAEARWQLKNSWPRGCEWRMCSDAAALRFRASNTVACPCAHRHTARRHRKSGGKHARTPVSLHTRSGRHQRQLARTRPGSEAPGTRGTPRKLRPADGRQYGPLADFLARTRATALNRDRDVSRTSVPHCHVCGILQDMTEQNSQNI